MTSQVTLTYTGFLAGATQAEAAALVGGVVLPQDLLAFYGVRVLSDSTPTASPVVRTIVLGFNPSSTATATAVLGDHGASGSPVKSVTVTGAGDNYVQPPIVSFTGGRAAGVEPSMFTPSANNPAAAVAYLKVVSATVDAAGTGYTAATKVTVVGKLKASGSPPPYNEGGPAPADEGVAAVLTPTIAGGHITGIAITSAGSGYVGIPEVVITDEGGGSGGSISVTMGVGEIVVLRGGGGYDAAPTVVLTPYFQALFPASSAVNQEAPFINLFTPILEQALLTPISAGTPVIA